VSNQALPECDRKTIATWARKMRTLAEWFDDDRAACCTVAAAMMSEVTRPRIKDMPARKLSWMVEDHDETKEDLNP